MQILTGLLRLRFILPVIAGVAFFYVATTHSLEMKYNLGAPSTASSSSATTAPPGIASVVATSAVSSASSSAPEITVTHLPTPSPVKAAYMTSCIASGKTLRAPLVKLIDETELNAIVIDIKDYTGTISFRSDDPRFVQNIKGCFVSDMKEFIASLHEKHIYVIGRVTVFQDQTFSKSNPDAAVKRKSDGMSWKDKKGLMFIDPGATEYWDHMVALGKSAYAIGFDEINFDYIRYPSDGNIADALFARSGTSTKSEMMKKFYSYLGGHMREAHIPSSADLFGMTTTNMDDLGIGQVLENALRSFDYVAPMVYPSHYPPNFNGWKNPNLVPYDIIHFSMTHAVARANALEQKESGWVAPSASTTASSTPHKFVPTGVYANKLRPWIQDFNYGKIYTEVDVRAEKKAVYDSGLTSWMVWDPKNRYTNSAYDKE